MSMNRLPITLAVALLISTSGAALSQAEHEEHHTEGSQAETETAPAQSSGQMQMMDAMPEQCRAMMQNMPQECMSAMQQTMQGGMMHQGGMMQGAAGQTASEPTASDATQAYQQAMNRMHGPMAEAIKAEDADVAFVRGMIPHHQGAIDMAKVVQQYGKDEQTQKWAAEIIAAQEREIAEMTEWLEKNAK